MFFPLTSFLLVLSVVCSTTIYRSHKASLCPEGEWERETHKFIRWHATCMHALTRPMPMSFAMRAHSVLTCRVFLVYSLEFTLTLSLSPIISSLGFLAHSLTHSPLTSPHRRYSNGFLLCSLINIVNFVSILDLGTIHQVQMHSSPL